MTPPCGDPDSGRTDKRLANSVAVGMAPAKGTTEASANGLSKLNHTAFRLAVYASQTGKPRHRARLASGGWLGSTAWDSHPHRPDEGFQLLISWQRPPFRKILGAIPFSFLPLLFAMIARMPSAAYCGIEVVAVEVEVDVSRRGFAGGTVVGTPDIALKIGIEHVAKRGVSVLTCQRRVRTDN